MNFVRKSRLFHREKIQKLEPKDFLKVAVMIGIIVIPLFVGLAV